MKSKTSLPFTKLELRRMVSSTRRKDPESRPRVAMRVVLVSMTIEVSQCAVLVEEKLNSWRLCSHRRIESCTS